jgi:histidine triad (HIT) family protein
MAEDCVFCKIARGEIAAQIVYQDEEVIAFRDIHPAASTHVLIIPRQHIDNIAAVDESAVPLMGRLILAAAQIARAEKIEVEGYRLVTNSGRNGGQSVWHLHWHLLGGRKMSWPPG